MTYSDAEIWEIIEGLEEPYADKPNMEPEAARALRQLLEERRWRKPIPKKGLEHGLSEYLADQQRIREEDTDPLFERYDALHMADFSDWDHESQNKALDEIEEIIAFLSAYTSGLHEEVNILRRKQEWRPISEAPKDGTPILVVDVNAKQPVAAFVWWDAPKEWDDDGEGVWRTTEPEIFEIMGGSATFPSPTHWQPLPTPPQDGDA